MTRLTDTQTGLLNDLSNGFGSLLPKPSNGGSDSDWSLSDWMPKVDIFGDEEDDLVFEIETPGFDRDDLDIQLQDNKLIIRGERTRETREEDGDRNYYRTERQFGSFRRVFNLPRDVSSDDIHAEYNDGVLKVSMPALESSEQKAIEVE
ncbi:MAG: Hsp20/alpha crystallin family protein [bacterium]